MRPVSRLAKLSAATVTALAIVLASALVTSADTAISHSGIYGRHYLADTAEYPGVHCFYGSGTVIRSISVRDPFVFARNARSGVTDTQTVGWFFQIQANSGSGWNTVFTSAVQKRTATDGQVANFTPLTKAFAGRASNNYRVVVMMRWYNSAGTVVGQARHRADWYTWEGVPSFQSQCPGGIF